MKTDELIAMLAQQESATVRATSPRRFPWAVAAGLAASALLVLLLGIRTDLGDALRQPAFWWKLAYALALAAGALLVTRRLARPGRRLQLSWLALVLPVSAALVAALVVLGTAPHASRVPLVLGSTWSVCPLLIALLSVPAFIAVTWAVRGFAPTRLAAAGAASGLLAGALATLAYCLHCPEMAVPFWAVWYTLGMLLPAAAGALLGPRLLRW